MRTRSWVLLFLLLVSTVVLAMNPAFLQVRSRDLDFGATHGMLIVGGRVGPVRGQAVLFSHLPMFMAPHDRQAIFEGSLDVAGTTAYLDPAQNPRQTFYTIDPGQFVLPDFLSGIFGGRPASRSAKLFTGIFDRGPVAGDPPGFRGIPVGRAPFAATFRRLLYGDIIPSAPSPLRGTPYVLIATSAGELFLVHRVTLPRREFDQFVEVRTLDASGSLARMLAQRGGAAVPVTAVDVQNTRENARGAANQPRLRLFLDEMGARSPQLEITTGNEAYFFTSDLN